jgi:23S rRNA pseudouridine2605 synthase
MKDTTQRIDKYLANHGVCSRRSVQNLLDKKQVTVQKKRITEAGERIRADDTVYINGHVLQNVQHIYYALHKPKEIISTASDEYGRKSITSLIPTSVRLYPIGRLDKNTTGLILLTNDGELTNLLTHPRYHVEKVYRLMMVGKITDKQIYALKNGVVLEDGKTLPATVVVRKKITNFSIVDVTLKEGRNRQIRRMCEVLNIKLISLKRIRIGKLALGTLPEGAYRKLSPKEVKTLRNYETRN